MRLLLLAGTSEARAIAAALEGVPGLRAVASLAGATRTPEALDLPTRVGGFGGRAAFCDWLVREGIGAVLDATHPFAAAMSHRAAAVSAEMGLAYLQVLRPGWEQGVGDRWTFLDAEAEAAGLIPEGATVFLATGRQSLPRFVGLGGRVVHCRVADPSEAPFPFAEGGYVVARPPFSVDKEIDLFRELGIDWLVVKNAGGAASRAKLDAARKLGLPVALIRRPAQPDAPRVATVADALAWARALV